MFKSGLINRIYNKYMISSLLGMTASFGKIILLCILVGNILGSGALAVTGIGRPLTFISLMIGNLIAVGGSTLCSSYMGKGLKKKAREVFTVSCLLAVVISILSAVFFLIFMRPFLSVVCAGNESLMSESFAYCTITAIGGMALAFINPVFYFIRLDGKPRLNIGLDLTDAVTCIGLFFLLTNTTHLGVTAAAIANVSGSALMAVIAMLVFAFRGNDLGFTGLSVKEMLPYAKSICVRGLPGGLENGFSFLRTFLITNLLAFSFGSAAVSAFSVVNSLNDILSIILIGMAGAALPFIGVFLAEHDLAGINKVLKQAIVKSGAAALLCTLIGCLFSRQIAALFGMKASEMNIAQPAVIAFSLCFLPAVLNYIIIMLHANNGHTMLANILMSCRTFAYLIAAVFLFIRAGSVGLVWYGFLIAELLTLVTAGILHLCIAGKNKNLSKLTLLDRSLSRSGRQLSLSVTADPENLAASCDKVSEFSEANQLDANRSMYLRLAAEELLQSVYLHAYEGRTGGPIDICMFMDGENVVMRLRYSGRIFNPIDYAASHKDLQACDDSDDFLAAGVSAVLGGISDSHFQTTLGINSLVLSLKPAVLTDFLCEKQLHKQNPALHQAFRSSVPILKNRLNEYESVFTNWTDHSYIHSEGVINQCNQLIGEEIDQLNGEELYVLLMSCLLHDLGMGTSREQLKGYLKDLTPSLYEGLDPEKDAARIIRQCHHELSALRIMEEWKYLKIPSEKYAAAIARVAAGHRKNDLFDTELYPAAFEVEPGKTVCLPYLASIIRYADELDIGPFRNLCEYNEETMTPKDILESRKNDAILGVEIHKSYTVIKAHTDDPDIKKEIAEMAEEIQKKASYCCDVAKKRTPFRIRQDRIHLHFS